MSTTPKAKKDSKGPTLLHLVGNGKKRPLAGAVCQGCGQALRRGQDHYDYRDNRYACPAAAAAAAAELPLEAAHTAEEEILSALALAQGALLAAARVAFARDKHEGLRAVRIMERHGQLWTEVRRELEMSGRVSPEILAQGLSLAGEEKGVA